MKKRLTITSKRARFVRSILAVFAMMTAALTPTVEAAPAASSSQKVVKDPVEYNAYMAAFKLTDPAAKAAALEAFVKSYPHSVVTSDALEQVMAAYQELGKVDDVKQTAQRLLAVDARNVRALAILTAIERVAATNGDAVARDEMRAHAEAGLKNFRNWTKPAGTSDAQYKLMRREISIVFNGALGYAFLNDKDYAKARDALLKAVAADPTDLQNTYQLGIAEVEMSPVEPNGFWHLARAANLARAAKKTAAEESITKFAAASWKRYHGSDDGWSAIAKAAGTHGAIPKNFAASLTAAPSAAEIAVKAVRENDLKTLSFSDYEFVLGLRDASPANKDAADKVWQTIQGMEKNGAAKLQIPVKVISATANSFDVAITDDNQKANVADMRVLPAHPLAHIPPPGAVFSIVGVISEYTPKPFLFTMRNAEFAAVAKAALPDGFYLVLDAPASSAVAGVAVPDSTPNSPPLTVSQQPIASSAQIANASATADSFGRTLITIELNAAGGTQMHATTAKSTGRRMAIVADGKAISVATIQEPVTDHIQISGSWTLAEANAIANRLSHQPPK